MSTNLSKVDVKTPTAASTKAPAASTPATSDAAPPQHQSQIAGFFDGFAMEGLDTIKGLYSLVTTNPITTAKGLVYMAAHPRLAFQAITEPYTTDIKQGKYGELAGRASFQVLSMVLTTGALGKVAKAAKGGEAVVGTGAAADAIVPSAAAKGAADAVVKDMATQAGKQTAQAMLEKQIADGTVSFATSQAKSAALRKLATEQAQLAAKELATNGVSDQIAQGLAKTGATDAQIAKIMGAAGKHVSSLDAYQYATMATKAGMKPSEIAANLAKFGVSKKAASALPDAVELMNAKMANDALIATASSTKSAGAIAQQMQRYETLINSTENAGTKAAYQAQLDALKTATAANPHTADLVARLAAGEKLGPAERALAGLGKNLDDAGAFVSNTGKDIAAGGRAVRSALSRPDTIGGYVDALATPPRLLVRGVARAYDATVNTLYKGLSMLHWPDIHVPTWSEVRAMPMPSPWQVMTAPVTVPLGAAKLAITHPGITAGTLALAGDLGNNAASGNALRQMGAADDASAPQDGSSTSTDGNFTWYQLQNGDTLQSIAKKQLGDANRWPEIYQANQDLFDSLGQNGTIPSGTKIKIPVDNTSPSSPSTNGSSDAAAYKQSLLKVLDQKIAASTGDTKTLLTQLRQRLATMPADQVYSLKDQLDAQGLTVDGGNQGTTPAPKPSPKPAPAPQAPGRPAPTAPTQTTPPSNGTRLYTVRQGDTLTGIAQSQLGDWNKWHTIVDMNQNRYPTLASNPDYIQSGWRLNLPVGSAGRTVSAASTSTPAPAPASTAPQNAAPAPGTVGPNTGTDAERQQLQNLLSQLGFDVQPTGKYDQSTADAVVAFKQMAGLPTDNADVDPDTKAAMQISLRLLQDPNVRSQANMEAAVHEAANLATGSIGPEVGSDQARALVQQYLQAVGYNVPVNGQFDQATLDALTQFKQQNGLAASYQDDQGNPVYTPYVDGPTAEALYNAASQTPSKSS